MAEDMSDLMNNLSNMLNNNQIPDEMKNFISNFTSQNSSQSDNSSHTPDSEVNNNFDNSGTARSSDTSNNSADGIPDIDINMIFKLKAVMDSMKNTKNDPRANLLLSLKPYLRSNKRDKVDQYVKLFGMSKLIEIINPLGGDNKT